MTRSLRQVLCRWTCYWVACLQLDKAKLTKKFDFQCLEPVIPKYSGPYPRSYQNNMVILSIVVQVSESVAGFHVSNCISRNSCKIWTSELESCNNKVLPSLIKLTQGCRYNEYTVCKHIFWFSNYCTPFVMQGIIAVGKELWLQSKYGHKGNIVQVLCHLDKNYVAKRNCYQVRPENISCMSSEDLSSEDLITIKSFQLQFEFKQIT